MSQASASYLLAGQATELERLKLQSRVWEPAARELLAQLPAPSQCAALDIGCGAMGWLRVLSSWVGPFGRVVGTDVDQRMLEAATAMVMAERLANVTITADDLFASQLPAASFDLVHSRFQIAPLGRAAEQMVCYLKLLRPKGILVVEDPDLASWRVSPEAPAVQELIALIERGFLVAGGNFNAGRNHPSLMRSLGLEPRVVARVLALEPGHPYLRLPLQFAAALRPRLESLSSPAEVNSLLERAEAELAREGTWGTTFTLVQTWAQVHGARAEQ